MFNLMENKQIIHIASEIIVLIAVIYYFNGKNKKLLRHIEDLAQRIEDQEELLEKNSKAIQELSDQISKLLSPTVNSRSSSLSYPPELSPIVNPRSSSLSYPTISSPKFNSPSSSLGQPQIIHSSKSIKKTIPNVKKPLTIQKKKCKI